jgi:hypothetical protein
MTSMSWNEYICDIDILLDEKDYYDALGRYLLNNNILYNKERYHNVLVDVICNIDKNVITVNNSVNNLKFYIISLHQCIHIIHSKFSNSDLFSLCRKGIELIGVKMKSCLIKYIHDVDKLFKNKNYVDALESYKLILPQLNQCVDIRNKKIYECLNYIEDVTHSVKKRIRLCEKKIKTNKITLFRIIIYILLIIIPIVMIHKILNM